ncbi:unnamed protein product, partial [Rotaria sordida]
MFTNITKKSTARKMGGERQELSPLFKITSTGRLQSIASFAQHRIWLDEQVYLNSKICPAVYNNLLAAIIKRGSMSIPRIKSAISKILEQHQVLRTAVRMNEETGQLEQM